MRANSFVGLGAIAASFSARAADWYDDASSQLLKVEQDSSGVIWPESGGSAVTITGHSGTCSASQVKITPPAGREASWLGMVLAAVYAGKPVGVYGTCNTGTTTIEATRVVVAYH